MKKEIIDSEIARKYSEETGSPFLDGLTGLVNHGFFHLTLEREIERCRRHGTTLTLGLVNIDAFKEFNEKEGRIEGDRLLKNVGLTIEESIRKTDLASRFTGDVFSILFAESCAENMFRPVHRLRDAINKLPGNPTVSIGMAEFSIEYTTAEDLFNRAGEALAKARMKGKNCISMYQTASTVVQDHRPKVLIVDDEPTNLKLLKALMSTLDYEVLTAESGQEALDMIGRVEIDLVLLDIMMPGMDGFEACQRIKNNPRSQMIPVILVTALDDKESRIKGIEKGADDFLTKPVNRVELAARTKSLIKLKMTYNNLASIENVLFSMARMIEAKDAYTQGHTDRVANLSQVIGRKMALSDTEMKALLFGGIMHDIGKIGVPNTVLNKPGKLDADEWNIMKNHSIIGYNIALPLERNLGPALQVIRHHHEKMDGSGYPDGLKGDQIPVVARIVGIADIYDALTTDRPYRKAMDKEKALEILQEEADSGKLDKTIVRNFIDYIQANESADQET